MKRTITILLFLIAGCALGIVTVGCMQRHQVDTGEVGTDFWSDRIKNIGPERAYKEFVTKYSEESFATQHLAAHMFGALLYDSGGLANVSVCDESFAFGCFHSFFARAIAVDGIDSITDLARTCRDRYGSFGTGCEHGIGHGIMEYFGPQRLLEALDACSKTDQKDELFGCTSGVFMEFNAATEFPQGIPTTITRRFDPDRPLYPCDSIPENYRHSCYFEIGLWWKHYFEPDYEKIGNLCTRAEKTSERVACYRGWGTVVAEVAGYDPEVIGTFCGQISEPSGPGECEYGAALRLLGTGTHQESARQICENVREDLQSECKMITRQPPSTPKP